MPFQLSPGVAVVEKDFSSIVPAVSSSAGAFAGPFAWGPIEDPVRVSSESDLVTRFGAPKNDNFQSFFTAANFLSYTNNLFVCRADAAGLRNAVAVKSSSVTGVTITSGGAGYVEGTDNISVTFSAPDIVGGTTATGTVVTTTNVVGGTTYLVVTGVTITNAGSGYITAPSVSFSQPLAQGGTAATATATVALGGVKIKNVSQYLDSFSNGTASYGPWAAKFAGTKGNGLRVVMLDSGSWTTASASIKALFTGAPGTSKFAADRGLADDEVHVVVFDNASGEFSGVSVPGTVLEKYSFVSKLSDARRSDGSNNYYKSVVNAQSKYVWWLDHDSATSDLPATTVVESGDQVTFAAGQTANQGVITVGSTTSGWASQTAYKTAFDAAPDKSSWKIRVTGSTSNDGLYNVVAVTPVVNQQNVIISYQITVTGFTTFTVDPNIDSNVVVTHIPKLDWGLSSQTAAQQASETNRFKSLAVASDYTLSGGTDDFNSTAGNIVAAYSLYTNVDQYDVSLVPVGNVSASTASTIVGLLGEGRKDCVVFISPSDNGDPITSLGDTATNAIIQYRNDTNINSSYAVMDSGWKYQYDRYNDAYRWVPLNGDIAGLCARTDYTADPWFSPGGFNRGQVKNVVKLGFNPSQADRDVLYVAGVNPVVNFPGQGVVLYGDKTMLTRPSAFDRINVRRLFIVLEKAIATAAKFQMFEFNDSFTRAQFRNLVEPFLRDVQGRRGVTDFRVKCDENNNTGEVIDRNEFIADIFIKPNRSINFITLNFVAARSSVSFEEIGG